MALTYQESAALMIDPVFVSRITVGCLTYATYIQGEATTVPAHNTRLRWAHNVLLNPPGAAAQIAPSVVMDPSVQAEGAAVTDDVLQTAVETAVNNAL